MAKAQQGNREYDDGHNRSQQPIHQAVHEIVKLITAVTAIAKNKKSYRRNHNGLDQTATSAVANWTPKRQVAGRF